jgi:hypothetical protein
MMEERCRRPSCCPSANNGIGQIKQPAQVVMENTNGGHVIYSLVLANGQVGCVRRNALMRPSPKAQRSFCKKQKVAVALAAQVVASGKDIN